MEISQGDSGPISYEFGTSIDLSLNGAPSISYLVASNRESGTVIAELCRREGIISNLYYRWSNEFLEAGKQRLAGNTKREADSKEVKDLRSENEQLN